MIKATGTINGVLHSLRFTQRSDKSWEAVVLAGPWTAEAHEKRLRKALETPVSIANGYRLERGSLLEGYYAIEHRYFDNLDKIATDYTDEQFGTIPWEPDVIY